MMLRNTNAPPENIQFYAKMGLALEKWQFIEIELHRIFMELIQSEMRKIVSLMYHNSDFAKRVLYITKMVEEVFASDTAALGEWKDLHTKIDAGYDARNELVHWLIAIDYLDPQTGAPYRALIPSITHPSPKKAGQKRDEAHLDKMISDFNDLYDPVFQFQLKVVERLASVRKSLAKMHGTA